MNWYLIFDVLPLLLDGALLTAQLTAASLLLGFVLALPLSLLRAADTAALGLLCCISHQQIRFL